MYDKPLPVIDPESAPYWAALKERRLILKHCRDCGRNRESAEHHALPNHNFALPVTCLVVSPPTQTMRCCR